MIRPASIRTGSTVSSPIGTAPALVSAAHSCAAPSGTGTSSNPSSPENPVRISQHGTPPTSTRSGRNRK